MMLFDRTLKSNYLPIPLTSFVGWKSILLGGGGGFVSVIEESGKHPYVSTLTAHVYI